MPLNPWVLLGAVCALAAAFGGGFYASSEYHANDVPAAREEWTRNALDDYRRVVTAAQKRIAAADKAREQADAQRIEDDRRSTARADLVRSVRDAAANADHVPAATGAACDADARRLRGLLGEGAGLANEGAGRNESRTREVNALFGGWPR